MAETVWLEGTFLKEYPSEVRKADFQNLKDAQLKLRSKIKLSNFVN